MADAEATITAMGTGEPLLLKNRKAPPKAEGLRPLGGFAINPSTGVVTVADGTKINYASAPGHAYTITVQASDGDELRAEPA